MIDSRNHLWQYILRQTGKSTRAHPLFKTSRREERKDEYFGPHTGVAFGNI